MWPRGAKYFELALVLFTILSQHKTLSHKICCPCANPYPLFVDSDPNHSKHLLPFKATVGKAKNCISGFSCMLSEKGKKDCWK